MQRPATKDHSAAADGCLLLTLLFFGTIWYGISAFSRPDDETIRRELEALRIAVAAYSLTIDELRR